MRTQTCGLRNIAWVPFNSRQQNFGYASTQNEPTLNHLIKTSVEEFTISLGLLLWFVNCNKKEQKKKKAKMFITITFLHFIHNRCLYK